VSRSLSKLRAVLAGLAVVAVVGLATPSVLGMVTVSLWTHGALFDVQGLARLALFLLDAVAWVAWLRIIVALCLDVASGLRQPNAPQRTGGVRGHLAGWVLGFVLLVLPGSAMGAGVAVAAPVASWVSVSSTGPDLTAAQAPPSAPISSVSSTRPAISPAVSPTEGADYTVVSGDCLSTIALHFYGDEGAWTEIWAANADRIMAGGMRFGDPNLIYAGWILTLPGLPGPSPSESMTADPPPTPPSVVHSPAPTVAPSRPADPPRASGQRPRDGLGDPKSSVPGRTQGASAPMNHTSAQSRRGQASVSAPGEAGVRGEGTGAATSAAVGGDAASGALVRWVPESAALGVSALVAAAYLRRIRRRRAQARAARGDDEAVATPDHAAVRLEARLAPFANSPALECLELANRHLTAALRAERRADPTPRIGVIRVGPDGVEALLDEAVDWAPGSFTLSEDGESWWLRADVDRTSLWPVASEELAWLPLLLPVGDDASGTYLLHLEPGDVVSLEGPDAPSMLAAWVEAAKSWPWAEQVGVARDSETAEALAPLFFGQRTPEERATVLFTGDPSVLSESAARTVASVTSNSSRATTSVTVTAEGAVIEPFHIAVRPCRLDPALEGALAAIDHQGLTRAEDAVNEGTEVSGESTEKVRGVIALRSSAELFVAGAIEVQLLTFTPQIVGLPGPLPTSKAVRITELVAWLGLQGARGSTSASMLDHGIVGATSTKTLYNMVSAARTALGTDSSGASRLIADRSTGVYRLAEDVTVDVVRFVQMAKRGIDSKDPHTAAELCTAALNLIDDTPVGNGSGRYGWWASLWEARIGRLATKAAGRLGELARLGFIDLEVARTGIEQARLAAGGEGELHRVAMVLEAWAGSEERVEHEWVVACAQADNLEAGSAPSTATESLLVATRRRWLDEEKGR
jgi:hypothetical protein